MPDEELQPVHELAPALVPADGFELERLVLIELEKKIRKGKTPREATVDALKQRERDAVPHFIVREAINHGARGRELALWVAAAAAAGAVALRFGPGAADQIPKVVRSVRNMAGVSSPFPRTGAPTQFNAASRLELVLRRRMPFGGPSMVGHDFSGTEG